MDVSMITFDKCVEKGDFTQFYFSAPAEIFHDYHLRCPDTERAEVLVEFIMARPVTCDKQSYVSIGPAGIREHDWHGWYSVPMDKDDIWSLVELAEREMDALER